MIPVLAALPAVGDVLGGVVGTVANVFSPAPTTTNPTAFSTAFNSASSAASAATISTSCGIMRAAQWNQMSGSELQTWAKGLAGRHIDATDAAGHTVTGTVNGVTPAGNDISLNINGHLVALSGLKQISWSATAAA